MDMYELLDEAYAFINQKGYSNRVPLSNVVH